MRIAIFGTGGVGGYFGGLLARAGYEIAFIARGAHLKAIKEHGLSIKSPYGDFNLFPVQATDKSEEAGTFDYVIVAVKHYHLQDAVSDMKPLVSSQTTVIPLLNGVDAHEHLIRALGTGPVVGGLSSIVSMIESPGVIRHESQLRRIIVGELDGHKSKRVERMIQAWVDCGIEAIHSDDILTAIWTKFLFIASFGGVSSLSRAAAGEILNNPETRNLLIQAMREVEALARVQEIALAPDIVQETMSFIEGLEPTATSSMQRDVASGRPFELEAFSGTILRLGRKFGVPTPVHTIIYALLRPALDRVMTKV